MARVEIAEVVWNANATPASFEPYTITYRDGSAADVYTAEVGGTVIAPVDRKTDARGRIEGWAEEGRYTITFPEAPAGTPPIYPELLAGVDAFEAPVAQLGMSAADSVASGAAEAVPWNFEAEDTHGQHDNALNNTRLTCVKAGLYSVAALVQWPGNATGRRIVQIAKNGEWSSFGFQASTGVLPTGSSAFEQQAVNPAMRLVVGDYIEVVVLQSSGGALAYGGNLSWLKWCWLRP